MVKHAQSSKQERRYAHCTGKTAESEVRCLQTKERSKPRGLDSTVSSAHRKPLAKPGQRSNNMQTSPPRSGLPRNRPPEHFSPLNAASCSPLKKRQKRSHERVSCHTHWSDPSFARFWHSASSGSVEDLAACFSGVSNLPVFGASAGASASPCSG